MALYMPRFPGLLNMGLCRGTAAGDMTPPTITLDVIGLTRGTVAPEPGKLKTCYYGVIYLAYRIYSPLKEKL